MPEKTFLILLGLIVSACSFDKGSVEETQKAIAYLRNDPTASSTDGMTFGDPGYWHAQCKAGTDLWKAAIAACDEDGRHPPVCEIIRSPGCP
ncbi:MAG: hypothetical protein K2P57_02845 [Burkholderiales bacterium]|nr:hypothetical protein [Burkholderiales bacterium]